MVITNKKANKNFLLLKKIFQENKVEIQQLVSLKYSKIEGKINKKKNLLRREEDKKQKTHTKIIIVFARNLDNPKVGSSVIKSLGVKIAIEAIEDGLTIDEVVDFAFFLKKAIWKVLVKRGILKAISTRDCFEFNEILGNYSNELANKISVTYHNYLTEKITRSEERFRALIEQSTDGIALVNTTGKVLYASPATIKLMGFKSEELLDIKDPFGLVHTDKRKAETELFQKLLKNPGSTEIATYPVKRKNGTYVWIESIMSNLMSNSHVNAIVLNYRDISERKIAERQKDDFISIATHELKTPVTSIKAYTQVLVRRFEKEGNIKAVSMLSKMDSQLNKLTNLIRDLLDVTRIDGGKLQFQEGPFNLKELVEDVVSEMQLTTTKHHINKNLTDIGDVCGDRERVGQVITNLLSNAIKYSPQSKKISVSLQGNKKEAICCVQDYGIGIPAREQHKVFERFFRVGDAGNTYGGLGLGLFICSEVVKRHRGKIWVESKMGKGSKFCFTLPVGKASKNIHLNRALNENKIYA